MEKETDIHWIGWVIALLPYEIGLLFMLFGSATLIQVVFFKAPLATILGMLIGSNL